MTNDLIRNLRDLAAYAHAGLSVADEAADEIEKLRDHKAKLTRLNPDLTGYANGYADALEDGAQTALDDDAKRIRTILLRNKIDELSAEIERLRKLTEWQPISDISNMEDPEPVIYLRPKEKGAYGVGIAYWTVSKKWQPELGAEPSPNNITHFLSLPDVPKDE